MQSRLRFLIIDDNRDDRELAIRSLQKEYTNADFVEIFDNDALEAAFDSSNVNVILTDYSLRWTDGLAVLRSARTRLRNVPVIMFTNTGGEEICAEAIRLGLFDYIVKKPQSYAKLPLSVAAALKTVEAQKDAARQKNWLHGTLVSIGDAVITTDTEGNVAFMNPVAESLTGWPLSSAIGQPLKNVYIVFSEETRQRRDDPVSRVLETGTTVDLCNHTILISKDGHVSFTDDCASPIRDAEGNLLGVVLVFRDVSERRELERRVKDRADKLADSDRRKDEFLAMLAHELRNPLAPVRNTLQIIRQRTSADPVVDRAVQLAERQVALMARLLDDLLDVSRITRGKIQLRKEVIDLNLTMNKAIEACRHSIEARGHTLSINLPRESPYIEADAHRFEQVICNLLTNAGKFTEPGGQISVDVKEELNQVSIKIRDNGIGIAADLVPRVFDLFTQADQSLERTQGGLGIGLTLVKRLTELHGGTVSVSSPGLGKGSEFVIKFPALVQKPVLTELPREILAAGPGKRRILIVDDNVAAVETLTTALQIEGHTVESAHDGPEAIQKAASFRPEVILLDIGLPGMSGHEVAKKIRSGLGIVNSVIIAVTGYGQEEERQNSRDAGMKYHLVKPLNFGELEKILLVEFAPKAAE